MNYSSNQDISLFVNRAKNKVGQLGGLLANEIDDEESVFITLSLSNLLESLTSPYLDWTEEEVLRIVSYWNNRADLNTLPYMQITDYFVNITGGTTTDLSNIENTVKDILSRTPHNSLAQIQGGSLNERYHLTKAQRDWVNCQSGLTPCPQVLDFLVTLGLITRPSAYPSGYYELGTSVSAIQLQGGISYGSDKQAISYGYKKDGVQLGSLVVNPAINSQPNVYIESSSISQDTDYSFEATFAGGTKSITKSIVFKQPMYYGVIKRKAGEYNIIADVIAKGTKDVRDKGLMSLSFAIPTDNTLLDYIDSYTPFLFIPASWGIFTSAINNTFNFASDFSYFGYPMPLADGTVEDGILVILNNQIEGNVTFDFNW